MAGSFIAESTSAGRRAAPAEFDGRIKYGRCCGMVRKQVMRYRRETQGGRLREAGMRVSALGLKDLKNDFARTAGRIRDGHSTPDVIDAARVPGHSSRRIETARGGCGVRSGCCEREGGLVSGSGGAGGGLGYWEVCAVRRCDVIGGGITFSTDARSLARGWSWRAAGFRVGPGMVEQP